MQCSHRAVSSILILLRHVSKAQRCSYRRRTGQAVSEDLFTNLVAGAFAFALRGALTGAGAGPISLALAGRARRPSVDLALRWRQRARGA